MPAIDRLSEHDFMVGEWLVQPRLTRIERGDGVAHVTPRAMAVLVYLAEAGGRVVSRNEVLDALWPRMTVTQDALARCLVELRKAFNDGSNGVVVIETIPKVGIRLTLPVTAAVERTVQRGARQRWLASQRTALGPTALAVLMLGSLVAAAIWLLARNGPDGGATQTSNELALNLYLSANEYSTRANRLEVLKHQEDLYRRATEADPAFASAWARLGRTHTSLHWYGLDRTAARLTLAEQSLRRALELEPGLPEAHLYLADYYFKGKRDGVAALVELAVAERSLADDPELYFLRSTVYRRGGQWERAIADGGKAIELDPRNVVYRRQQHITYTFMRDYVLAQETLNDLLSLVPDDGTALVDNVVLALIRGGDTALANRYEAALPSARYDDGLAYTYTRWLAAVFDRDYAKARAVLDAATETDVFNGDLRTSTIPKASLYAVTYRLAGDTVRARAQFQTIASELEVRLSRSVTDDPVVGSALYIALAEAQAGSGDSARASASVRRARDLMPKSVDALSGSATQLAAMLRVLIPAGEHDIALSELDDYLSGPGQWSIEGLAADPRLDPIRTEPAFAALREKYRAR